MNDLYSELPPAQLQYVSAQIDVLTGQVYGDPVMAAENAD